MERKILHMNIYILFFSEMVGEIKHIWTRLLENIQYVAGEIKYKAKF